MKLLIVLVAALALAQAFHINPPKSVRKERSLLLDNSSLSAAMESIVTMFMKMSYSLSVDKVALDLDKNIAATSKENIVFSPLSIGSTLLTLLAASNGTTYAELQNIFKGDGINIDMDYHDYSVHEILGSYLAEASTMKGPNSPQTNHATGIFVQDKFALAEAFLKIIRDAYKSNIEKLDFVHHAKEAQTAINNWVSNVTNGKIPSMLTEAPEPTTQVILASALYFQGIWKYPFIDEYSKRAKFTVEEDDVVEADMMYNNGFFPFHMDYDQGVKIIGLPYRGSEEHNITMYAVQPLAKGAAALAEFKKKLTVEMLHGLIGNMTVQECIVAFPKMNLSSSMNLKEPLKSMGLKSLFTPEEADLSLLSPPNSGEKPVFYTDILHKVEMSIDEKGTEAAAATSTIIDRSGIVGKFVANRPFVFFIKDNDSGLTWFWATINRPTPNY